LSLEPKPVKASQVEMTEIVLPNDANQLGNILGGRVMHLIDIAAAMAATRHSRRVCVTASMDRLNFLSFIKVGYIIILKASVNYTDRTSMEIGVKVLSENPLTGEQKHTSTAYLTFVALNEHGKPTPVPPVVPETPEEKQRFENARKRRNTRLERIKEIEKKKSLN